MAGRAEGQEASRRSHSPCPGDLAKVSPRRGSRAELSLEGREKACAHSHILSWWSCTRHRVFWCVGAHAHVCGSVSEPRGVACVCGGGAVRERPELLQGRPVPCPAGQRKGRVLRRPRALGFGLQSCELGRPPSSPNQAAPSSSGTASLPRPSQAGVLDVWGHLTNECWGLLPGDRAAVGRLCAHAPLPVNARLFLAAAPSRPWFLSVCPRVGTREDSGGVFQGRSSAHRDPRGPDPHSAFCTA